MIPLLSHRLISRVRYSYWFVPMLMTVLAAGLAVLMGWVDDRAGSEITQELGWIYGGGHEGARSVLSTVASSMITVAGVVFSITIVALTLASSQFGPRLLRNFMRDAGNQITLGTFLATFVYCLLVVRTVQGPDSGRFVPHASVTVAVALALTSLVVLIYFIHHAASSIQAPHVIASVAHDLDRAIDDAYPEEIGEDADGEEAGPREPRISADVCARETGYVQAVDDAAMMGIATHCDITVVIVRRPGDYVVAGEPLARVAPPSRANEDLARRVHMAFVIASQRSVEQDVGFAFEQLVSIGVRALSPGINDPFTAIQCIERIGAGFARLAGRRVPSAWRLDDAGTPRVLAHPVTFADVLEATYGMIRPYACSNPQVMARMLDMIGLAGVAVCRAGDRRALAEQARVLQRQGQDATTDEHDRLRLRARYEAAMAALSPRASGRES